MEAEIIRSEAEHDAVLTGIRLSLDLLVQDDPLVVRRRAPPPRVAA